MKLLTTFVCGAVSAVVLLAQSPVPVASLKTFASSADVQALIARAKSEHKEGQAIVTEPILQFAPYAATLEYRASAGAAAVHPDQAEMMYVIEGSATLITGGKLTGKTIEGGESRNVSKGDFLVVPEGTPHWFSAIDSTLVLMTIKMPRGAAAAH
jgi:mannose-6-phosphate isomerase-like protein (cupin superfamily)